MKKYNVDWLLQQLDEEKKIKYLFFWGHRPNKDGSLGLNCLSQWWLSEFEVGGCLYRSAEHWMMAEKARLFGDTEIWEQILAAESPGEAKKLGRRVRRFDQQVWEDNRFEIVVTGNVHKFSDNKALKSYLLNTGERVLVEASPVDVIWGIGYAKDHEKATYPSLWRGTNLLGFALMEVRDRLKKI